MLYFADQGIILLTMLKIGAVGLAIAAVLYAVWAILTKKRFPAPMKTHILRYVFLTYLVCVLFLTLMPQAGSAQGEAKANLIPFFSVIYAVNSGHTTAMYLIILNIILFVPMGVLLPCVFKKAEPFWVTALLSLGATLTIEMIQIFLPGRAFDIDDVLFNAIGAVLGYAFYAAFTRIFKQKKRKKCEIAVVCAVLAILPVIFGVSTLLQNTKEFKYQFQYQVLLPKEIEFTYDGPSETSAPVYKRDAADPYDKIQGLMDTFGVTGEIEEMDTGLFVYSGEDSYVQYSIFYDWTYRIRDGETEKLDITDEEAQKIAKDALLEYDLWDDSLQLQSIEEERGDISGKYPGGFTIETDPVTGEDIYPEGIEVVAKHLYFTGEGAENWSTIEVYVDSEGTWIISGDDGYALLEQRELKTPEQAVRDLKWSDRCFMDSGILEPESFTVTSVCLTYADSEDYQYKLPAWKLSGSFYGYDFRTDTDAYADGYIIVEALK